VSRRTQLLFGTTSYVLPDHLLPNVRLLTPLVDDIELVLFEGEQGNLPTPAEVAEMRRLADDHDSGFTVHLPLDTGIGEPEPNRRHRAQDACLRLMDLTRPLDPHAFVLHPELPAAYLPASLGERAPRVDSLSTGERELWLEALGESAGRLRAEAGCSPLALENLQFPFAWLEPVLSAHDLAVTMDVGHLMLLGASVPDHLARFGPRLAVVHLHGLRDGIDHQDLGAFSQPELAALLLAISEAAAPRPVVVTLEVFGPETTPASLEALSLVLDDAQGGRMARAARAVRVAVAGYPRAEQAGHE
jgi:sugar phosphate isomerase/epimerase